LWTPKTIPCFGVLAIGASVVLFVVLGYLLQRERAKELVAEIRRDVKRD
jgi:hypothetical protein